MPGRKVNRTRRYTDEEIDRALLQLALRGGSARNASDDLAEAGLRVPPSTMVRWRDKTYVERYQYMLGNVAPQIEEQIVKDLRENALSMGAVNRVAIELVLRDLIAGKMDGVSAAKAAKDLGISNTGFGIDKLLLLTGRETQRVSVRTFDESVAELKELLPGFGLGFRDSIEGQAIDVTPQLLPGVEHTPGVEHPVDHDE